MAIVAGNFNTTIGSSSSLSAVVSAPSGIQVGDVLIVSMSMTNQGGTITPPAGWVEIATIDNIPGANGGVFLYSAYKVIEESGDIRSSYVWDGITNHNVASGMQIFRGVDTTNVIDVAASINAQGVPVTSIVVPSVTTVTNGAMAIGCMGSTAAGTNTSTPTGMTEEWDTGSTSHLTALYTETRSPAGATGSRTFSRSDDGGVSQNSPLCGVLFALRPEPSGTITLSGDPTGTIQEITPDFDGIWISSGAAMQQVQVRILNSSGTTVLQTGSEYNISDVASPNNFTVTWAQSGLSNLNWGTQYQYQMSGFDGTLWSGWSAGRSFSTNSAPTIPSSLQPNTTAIAQTSLPLLRCQASDADDTVATGLTVTAEILDDTSAVIATQPMTFDAGQSRWEYQTTGTDIPSFDTYTWRAYSFDGTLYSGEKLTSGTATRSAAAAFTYAAGPTVTLTSPTASEVLTSNSLTVTWTISAGTQQSYGITVYDDTGTAVITYNGGVSAAQTKTFTDVQAIRNGNDYTVTVNVETTLAATGVSAEVPFSVAYPAPDALSTLTATPAIVSTDLWASSIDLAWSQTAYGTDVFSHYTVSRTIATGPNAGTVILALITSPTQASFTDYFPPSGVTCTYSVMQSTIEGADIVTSDPVEAVASITLGGVVLCSVSDPATLRTSLKYTDERDFPRAIDETVYQASTGVNPVTVRSPKRTILPAFDARIFTDGGVTADDRLAELVAVDVDGGTLCYRDNHGRKLFVTMPSLTITDQIPGWYVARLAMRAESFTEGLS